MKAFLFIIFILASVSSTALAALQLGFCRGTSSGFNGNEKEAHYWLGNSNKGIPVLSSVLGRPGRQTN